LENTNNSDEALVKRLCYICGVDLVQQYKKDNAQQNDLNASLQKFPEMILWNGKKEELCASCYIAHVEGMSVYMEKYPEFKRPKPREW